MASLRLDLHLHTTASDGQLTPAEVVAQARAHGLHGIAITDHDTTNGIREAQRAAGGSPVVVPGIELSAEMRGADVHILGYFVDIDDGDFQAALAEFRAVRLRRAEQIVERLAAMGMPLEWGRVQALAGGGAIGRPHIAQALVAAGYVRSIKEAFARYLHHGGPAYVARKRLSPEAAIALLHSAGGVAVIAHPGLVADCARVAGRLVPAGLDGIEVVHPHNPPHVEARARELAAGHDLIMTGGSDFHRPDGDTVGAFLAPDGCLAALRARAVRYSTSANGRKARS